MEIDCFKDRYSNFRNKQYRKGQVEALERIINSDKKIIAIKADTGTGKSLIGMACLSLTTMADRDNKGLYLVHSKALQDQLGEDFPEAAILYGRGNYPCLKHPNQFADTCTDNRRSRCKWLGRCEYKMMKKIALGSNLTILNYAYYLTETNYIGGFDGRQLVILDEADKLESLLIDYIGLGISERMMNKLRLRTPRRRTLDNIDGMDDWENWTREGLDIIEKKRRELDREIESWDSVIYDSQVDKIKEAEKLETYYRKFQFLFDFLDKSWICQVSKRNPDNPIWTFRPLWVLPELAYHILWKRSKKFILMSATLHPQLVLEKLLGIDRDSEDVDYFEVVTDFKPEHRPIYLMNTVDMSMKKQEENIPGLIEAIKGILEKHKQDKGLIHTVSFTLTSIITDKVNDSRLIAHGLAGEDNNNYHIKKEALEIFEQSDKPLVLVSHSSDRGLDLRDELARFIIIVKAPFLNLGDKIVSKRVYTSPLGQYWYTSDMLLTVQQMSGRGMRHKDDYCTVYILDSQVAKYLYLKPSVVSSYFKECIV